MAPAIQPGENPNAVPMPSKAIPIVAMVVHELPVSTETNAQMMHAANKNAVGWMIFIPYTMNMGTTPLIIQVADKDPIIKRINKAPEIFLKFLCKCFSKSCQCELTTILPNNKQKAVAKTKAI